MSPWMNDARQQLAAAPEMLGSILQLIVTTPGRETPHESDATRHRHVIVAGSCTTASAAPAFDRLTLRTMRGGAELLKLGTRRVRLDECAYITVNAGTDRSSVYVGNPGVRPLVIAFRPGSLAQSMAAPDIEGEQADLASDESAFLETLQAHGDAVTQHLQHIEHRLRDDDGDAVWWEERLALLLSATIDANRTLHRRESTMVGLKAATRRELFRRVLLASDYIQSAYDEPINLQDIAAAAHLSRFHLVRLFQRAHGLTPHAYLTRKRLTVALRLIAHTALGLDDIAERAGLGTRSSLFRHLQREQGNGAAALRARATCERPCTISV